MGNDVVFADFTGKHLFCVCVSGEKFLCCRTIMYAGRIFAPLVHLHESGAAINGDTTITAGISV